MPLYELAIPLLLVGLALAGTAVTIDSGLKRGDSEQLFWGGFTGVLAVILTAVWAVSLRPAEAPLVGLLVTGGAAAAGVVISRRHARRRLAAQKEAERLRLQELAGRHEAVLLRWSAYELDPFKALELPGIHDVQQDKTRQLVRAVKTAESARTRLADGSGDAPEYEAAVRRLEEALAAAEDRSPDGRAA